MALNYQQIDELLLEFVSSYNDSDLSLISDNTSVNGIGYTNNNQMMVIKLVNITMRLIMW